MNEPFDVVGDQDFKLVYEDILYDGKVQTFKFKAFQGDKPLYHSNLDHTLFGSTLDRLLEDQVSNDMKYRGKELKE